MASRLSVSLSTSSPEWRSIFELQNMGDFAGALQKLSSIAHVSDESSIFADIVAVNLRICVGTLKGIRPDEPVAFELLKIIEVAERRGFKHLVIEASFLLFDCFPQHGDQALSTLATHELYMDEDVGRRLVRRKGISHVRSGNLQAAADLYAGYCSASGDKDTDQDDSLAALLLDYGRVSSQLGKYSDAVELYNQALCVSKSATNQALSLIRLSNALERISRPAQADKRRIEYFNMIDKEYPTRCALCSASFGKEPKFLLPCCKTVTHSECLRTIVSDHPEDDTTCPFCSTHFIISEIADPTSVSARKYQRHKKSGEDGNQADGANETELQAGSE